MGAIAEAFAVYAQPLLDQTDGSEGQLSKAFMLSQLCYNLALVPEDSREKAIGEMRPSLEMNDEEFDDFRNSIVVPMIRRHQEMFPQMHGRDSTSSSRRGTTVPERPRMASSAEAYPRTDRYALCPCNSGRNISSVAERNAVDSGSRHGFSGAEIDAKPSSVQTSSSFGDSPWINGLDVAPTNLAVTQLRSVRHAEGTIPSSKTASAILTESTPQSDDLPAVVQTSASWNLDKMYAVRITQNSLVGQPFVRSVKSPDRTYHPTAVGRAHLRRLRLKGFMGPPSSFSFAVTSDR